MDFLADESCAGPVIRALREAGHDVVAIVEIAQAAPDEQVLELALNEKRVQRIATLANWCLHAVSLHRA